MSTSPCSPQGVTVPSPPGWSENSLFALLDRPRQQRSPMTTSMMNSSFGDLSSLMEGDQARYSMPGSPTDRRQKLTDILNEALALTADMDSFFDDSDLTNDNDRQ